MLRIGIRRPDDYVANAGLNDRIRARAGSTGGGTRFQRYVEDGGFWYGLVESAKAFDFCVRSTRAFVMSFRHDISVDHQHRAYRRVGAR
jgi:hypothetical protein